MRTRYIIACYNNVRSSHLPGKRVEENELAVQYSFRDIPYMRASLAAPVPAHFTFSLNSRWFAFNLKNLSNNSFFFFFDNVYCLMTAFVPFSLYTRYTKYRSMTKRRKWRLKSPRSPYIVAWIAIEQTTSANWISDVQIRM
jgi:hypothetical protein